jgi:phosphopantothenoylcysteine decarboxylase / phosphopantothenate---cysteine ligase
MNEQPRILLGVTGSIAAYKAVELARLMSKRGAVVQVALTRRAQEFVAPLTFQSVTARPVLFDLFALSDRIEHVERAHEVDLAIIAPASANTIAKLACGLADDPVTATVLATRAPILIAPAMETNMWENAATRENVAKLLSRGVEVIGPAEGELASGRSGAGRMVEPEEICEAVFARLTPKDLVGVDVLITAGPTWEPIDPVRVLTNRSTGAMGIALARAAKSRGARVTLVLGPTHLPVPANVELVRVETAEEMLEASVDRIADQDVVIASAAVSDYRPNEPRTEKLKRSDPNAGSIALVENPDVLASLAKLAKMGAVIVGFAAETGDLVPNAREKMAKKGCHLVIANRVGRDRGFGGADTEVIAVDAEAERPFGPAGKDAVAQFVLDQVVRLREQLRRG